jgi:nucleoside-diphosphate-sugar epimerase
MDGMKHLLCFGFGFSAQELARQLDRTLWRISATSRSDQGLAKIAEAHCAALHFSDLSSLENFSHVLVSTPPDDNGDPVIAKFSNELVRRRFKWVGYLSTTGVYGHHGGDWITEETALQPSLVRSRSRVMAETQWLELFHRHGLPVHFFRLAGIYGPGRNALEQLRAGKARRIIKPGQIFSRIHVEDIAGILAASMAKPCVGRAYNCADDEPCPPQDVITYAARLLGVEPPPEEDFATAALSPMARSFYADCKKVANGRIKTELGVTLRYPTYREGLAACLQNS